jgi:hypothetical protein
LEDAQFLIVHTVAPQGSNFLTRLWRNRIRSFCCAHSIRDGLIRARADLERSRMHFLLMVMLGRQHGRSGQDGGSLGRRGSMAYRRSVMETFAGCAPAVATHQQQQQQVAAAVCAPAGHGEAANGGGSGSTHSSLFLHVGGRKSEFRVDTSQGQPSTRDDISRVKCMHVHTSGLPCQATKSKHVFHVHKAAAPCHPGGPWYVYVCGCHAKFFNSKEARSAGLWAAEQL